MDNDEQQKWLKRAGIFLIFLAAACVVYWPLVFGGGVFAHGWTLLLHYPALSAMEKSIQLYRELPLWMTGVYGGFPLFIGNSWGALSPLTLALLLITDFLGAYHALTILATLASLGATYGLARNFSLSRRASMIAAFTYAFSQFAVVWSHGNVWSQTFFFPPLLFLLLLKIHGRIISSRPSAVITLFGGGAVAIAFVSGVIDVLIYALCAGFIFSLYLDWQARRTQTSAVPQSVKTFFRAWRVTARFIFMVAIGGILASPLIIPTLRIIDVSQRADASTIEKFYSGGGGGVSLGDAAFLVYPHFFENLPHFRGHPWIYMGTLSLFLGLWGIIRWRSCRNGKLLLGLLGTTFLTTLPYSPLYWLIIHIPPMNRLNGSWKILPVTILIFAIFSGVGFDRLAADFKTRAFGIFTKTWQWFCGFMFAGVALFNIVWHSQLYAMLEHWIAHYLVAARGGIKPQEHYREVFGYFADKLGENLSFGNRRFVLALAFLAASWILVNLWRSEKFSLRKLETLTCALVILNFLVIWQDGERFLPKDILQTPQTLKIIQEQRVKEPFRITLALPDASLFDLPNESFEERGRRNRLIFALGGRMSPELFGLEGLEGDDPLSGVRYDRILTALGPSEEHPVPNPEFAKLALEEKPAYVHARTPLYSAMNVRFLITPYETLEAPWRRIDSSDVVGITLFVYENTAVLPRAHFAERVQLLEPDTETSFGAFLKNHDFRNLTLIECPAAQECPTQENIKTPDEARVELSYKSPRNAVIEVYTPTARWLVLSDHNIPYWQARIDGKPTPIYTANYVYRGVFVPAGSHTVEFVYPGLLDQTRYALRDLIRKPNPYAPYVVH